MATSNGGQIFNWLSLRQTQGTFLKPLWRRLTLRRKNDAARTWPSALLHTIDRKHDADLANAVSTTEIMVADFYKTGIMG